MQITLDTSKVDQRLDGMLKQLVEFPHEMEKEFLEWQAKDMHRRTPQATADQTGVETIITPRGVRSKPIAAHQKSRFATRARMGVRRAAMRGSKRPILRVELYEKLVKRMGELMSSVLAWNKVP